MTQYEADFYRVIIKYLPMIAKALEDIAQAVKEEGEKDVDEIHDSI